MSKKTITLCSSASFYEECLEIEEKLKELGFAVKVPSTAYKMRDSGNFNPEVYKTWFKKPNDYHRKTELIEEHFKKVIAADAVLVVNGMKNGLEGYIGGNVLMEMTVAFVNKKLIFILRKVSENSPLYEEILGLQPIFIKEDLLALKEKIN